MGTNIEAEKQAQRDRVAAAICSTVTDKSWDTVKKTGHASFIQKMFLSADRAIAAMPTPSNNPAERERIPF